MPVGPGACPGTCSSLQGSRDRCKRCCAVSRISSSLQNHPWQRRTVCVCLAFWPALPRYVQRLSRRAQEPHNRYCTECCLPDERCRQQRLRSPSCFRYGASASAWSSFVAHLCCETTASCCQGCGVFGC